MLSNTRSKIDGLDAIAAGRILCAYQPVRPVGLSGPDLYREGLARLIAATGEVRGAGHFIPQLEASGDIGLFDAHMTGLVLDDLAHTQNAAFGYNVSAETLQCPKAWSDVRDRIVRCPELAARLVLEITETRPVRDPVHLNATIAEIQRLGCRVAIDDFGAGYLSPAQLLQLDPDMVKIDASLLWKVRGCPRGANTLRHMVSFASCIAPVVIVEGVECPEHLEIALEAGATHVQGYLVGKPAMADLPAAVPAAA